MKLKIHPLFFAFGIYFALTGKVFLFLTFTFTALIHEYGHAIALSGLGYKINDISLMPYGTVVNGAIEGLSYKDEIRVALAGPLANLLLCIFFVSLWWLVPDLYAYTDTVVFSNLSIAAVNLLPAYPLDGGRVFSATLSLYVRRKKAMAAARAVGVVLAAALAALFLYSVFVNALNLSLAFFCSFILIGSLTKTKENAYVKAYCGRRLSGRRVCESKNLIVSSDATLKQLLAKTDHFTFYTVDVVFEREKKTVRLNLEQTERLLESYCFYEKIGVLAKQILTKKIKPQ